jgi:hypothetical protein
LQTESTKGQMRNPGYREYFAKVVSSLPATIDTSFIHSYILQFSAPNSDPKNLYSLDISQEILYPKQKGDILSPSGIFNPFM